MPDEDASQRTFDSAMEIWFEPEIRRRQESGAAPKPFPLRAAQVLIYPDARPHKILLNEEVQVIGHMKLKAGITKNSGDPIYLHEVDEIPKISLPDTTDPNCGHFTMLLMGDRWLGFFDFRYNKAKIPALLSAAEEFFETASAALASNWRRAAVDNLFSAADLAAKAYVLSTPSPDYVEPQSHGHIHSRFNMLSMNGNVETSHRKAFNELYAARDKARYVKSPHVEEPELIAKWQAEIRGLISHVRRRAT